MSSLDNEGESSATGIPVLGLVVTRNWALIPDTINRFNDLTATDWHINNPYLRFRDKVSRQWAHEEDHYTEHLQTSTLLHSAIAAVLHRAKLPS